MSSPIAILSINANTNANTNFQSAQSPNMASRSLPGNTSGLYVPVHRRGVSTSSTSSSSSGSFERGSLSPIARPTHGRPRSVSPLPRIPRSPGAFGTRHLDVSPGPSPRKANIPLASMIPNTYTISQLLALSSSPAPFSPSDRAQIDAHVPFMTCKPKSSSPKSSSPKIASPKIASLSLSSPAPSSSSTSSSSSHVSEPAPLPAAPAPAPTPKSSTDAQKTTTRRRRPGRKNSAGKPRVAPALGADVEERRRRQGANWGWAVHAPERESWRPSRAAAGAVVVA